MRCNSLFPFVLFALSAIHHHCENVRKIWWFFAPCKGIQGCVPLGWSGSGSVIRDHSDHSRSNEPVNPCPQWIHRFIWSTMIQVISDHKWSWSGSSQRNAPQDNLGFWIPCHGFQSRNCIPDSLSVELGLWSPIVSGIPNSLSCIFRNPMPRIPDSSS